MGLMQSLFGKRKPSSVEDSGSSARAFVLSNSEKISAQKGPRPVSSVPGTATIELKSAGPSTSVNTDANRQTNSSDAFRSILEIGSRNTVVMSVEQVPPYSEVLTGYKGRFELPETLRHSLVAVLRKGEDDSAIVLVERSLPDFAIASDLEGRIERSKLRVNTMQCDASVIREIYNGLSSSKKADAQSEESSQQRRKFDQLIKDGLKAKASDIQIHTQFARVSVKFMIHGEWVHHHSIPYDGSEEFMRAIYDHIAGIEKDSAFNMRQSQDAVATVFCPIEPGEPDAQVRVRIHTQPEQGGFCMYLRILPINKSDVKARPFEAFGYEKFQASALIRMSRMSEGAILFVGTTGSGKTTSLHNCMLHISEVHRGRKNIITVEDPPEIYIPGAHQTFVDSGKKGGGWTEAMRSAMRSIPDYVMVGEIRDNEPAQLVVDMTMSGHGLLSSLHAGGGFQAVDRLAEMGIRPTTLANPKFLTGIVYQRLLPILCNDCKQPYSKSVDKNDAFEVELFDRYVNVSKVLHLEDHFKSIFVRGHNRDCPTCHGQGSVGRTVAAEVIELGELNLDYYDYFRENKVSVARDLWIARGGITALHHGVTKVFRGLVDPHEIEGKLGPLKLLTRYAALIEDYKKTHQVYPLTNRVIAHSLAGGSAPEVSSVSIVKPDGTTLNCPATVIPNPDGTFLVIPKKPVTEDKEAVVGNDR